MTAAGESVYFAGSPWTVILGVDSRGLEPVREFLDGLEDDYRKRLQVLITNLARLGTHEFFGHKAVKPYFDFPEVKIWEFKVRADIGGLRILFGFRPKNRIILLRGFVKKEDEADPAERDRARDVHNAHTRKYPDPAEPGPSKQTAQKRR